MLKKEPRIFVMLRSAQEFLRKEARFARSEKHVILKNGCHSIQATPGSTAKEIDLISFAFTVAKDIRQGQPTVAFYGFPRIS